MQPPSTPQAQAMNHRQRQPGQDTNRNHLTALQRKPVRISITISHALHQSLMHLSDEQGRSLSNLAAYLLETGNAAHPGNYQPAMNMYG